MGAVTHAGPATGAFGGAPYGATKRVRDVPKWWRRGEEEEEGGARRCLFKNEDPTPQDGWEIHTLAGPSLTMFGICSSSVGAVLASSGEIWNGQSVHAKRLEKSSVPAALIPVPGVRDAPAQQ